MEKVTAVNAKQFFTVAELELRKEKIRLENERKAKILQAENLLIDNVPENIFLN